MSVVLRLWAAEGLSASPLSDADKAKLVVGVATGKGTLGLYVKDCEVDANDGRGEVTFTDDKAEAKQFPDVGAAYQFYGRQSITRPLRPDGKPNRPLTAYNITFERI